MSTFIPKKVPRQSCFHLLFKISPPSVIPTTGVSTLNTSTDILSPRRETLTPKHPCSSKKVFLEQPRIDRVSETFRNLHQFQQRSARGSFSQRGSLPRPSSGGSHPERAATSQSFQGFTADGEHARSLQSRPRRIFNICFCLEKTGRNQRAVCTDDGCKECYQSAEKLSMMFEKNNKRDDF